jgi:hypothetical protein
MSNKLNIIEIKNEFARLNKKYKRNWTLVKIVHDKYPIKNTKKFGRTWKVFFNCQEGHRDVVISLSNLRKNLLCGKCAGYNLTIEERINLLSNIHNNYYNYDEFKKEGCQGNSKKLITIVCPKHGKFTQSYDSHRGGAGCRFCAGNIPKKGKEISKIVKEFSHGCLEAVNLDPEKEYKSAETIIEIKCNLYSWHKNQKRTLRKISRGSYQCKYCLASRYELRAYMKLNKLGVEYEIGKTIKYKDGSNGWVDIVIKDKKGIETFIEIDGEQHFSNKGWKGNYEDQELFVKNQKRDDKKNKYAKSNKINLIRIRYDENIEEIIQKIVKEGNFIKIKKSTSKKIGNLNTQEKLALTIHNLNKQGKTNKEIQKITGTIGTRVSKILRGHRFYNLFISLYPDGANPYLKSKGTSHYKFTKDQKLYLDELLSKQYLHTKIDELFEKKFSIKLGNRYVSFYAKKNSFKSAVWVKLTKDQIKFAKKERKKKKSWKEICEYLNNHGVKISRPTLSKIVT